MSVKGDNKSCFSRSTQFCDHASCQKLKTTDDIYVVK